jgi:hypothetical protein|tara:strand:+ start:24 stop:176 length:153 start_codon:yes stop_codon:yes gene_type:complete
MKKIDTQALIDSMRRSLNSLEEDIADFDKPHKMTHEVWLDFCAHDWEMLE